MINVLVFENISENMKSDSIFLKNIDGFNFIKCIGKISDAENSIKELKPELVILNMDSNFNQGTGLIKWIRNEELECDVIFISSETNANVVKEAFRYGAIDYLLKPVEYKRFEKTMKKYLELKNVFFSSDELSQELIDSFNISSDFSEIIGDDQCKDTIKNNTCECILKFLKNNNEMTYTSSEIAKKLSISRITARRYLDFLEKSNILVMKLEYGKIGRPKNKYMINEEHK